MKQEATEAKQATSKRSNSGSRTAVKYTALLLVTVGLFRIGMSSPVPAQAAVLPVQGEATATEVAPRSDGPFRDDPRALGNSADDGGYLYYLDLVNE